jgi:hypothetical protein
LRILHIFLSSDNHYHSCNCFFTHSTTILIDMTTMANLPVSPHDSNHWPSLGAAEIINTDEWEMVAPDDFECQRLVDVVPAVNSKILKHAASSPDFRRYLEAQDDSADDGNDDALSQGPSSVVFVSAPPSVASTVSRVVSFRDAILQQQNGTSSATTTTTQTKSGQQQQRKFKTKFIVKPITRSAKSAPNLQALEEEEVLGDTDAHEYYTRKSMGYSGRQNGLKVRPDEAKRLQMTMQKKQMQQQSQRS